ncbi:MAG: sulfite exporter TauE/SafE family protein [Sandaracinaceae bacterium]|nr:sulfite exporter TauE/SafE family protein [Sandaracinaceae bacterium]
MPGSLVLDAEGIAIFAVVLIAGAVAGFVNTVAGGGSLLTLPALMLAGLPAPVANGTNRLAIVAQSISGTVAFHRQGMLPTKAIVPIVLPTVAGAIGGAALATQSPAWLLEPILIATMIGMAILMVIKPGVLPERREDEAPRSPWSPAGLAGLVLAGAYGGFVQAGVGFVLLAVLGGLLRYDAVRGNALKVVCTLVFTLPALAIFAYAGQIRWEHAVILAIGNALGSQLGVRFAVRVPAKVLRAFVVVSVVAMGGAALLKRLF